MDARVNIPCTTAERVLTLVRLRARRLSLWVEAMREKGLDGSTRGTAPPADIARILAAEETARDEAAFLARGAARGLGREIEATRTELEHDAAWNSLLQTFCLTRDETDLLLLLVALDLDPQLSHVVAYLHGDKQLVHGTPWISARLAGRAPAPFETSRLRAWLLAAPVTAGAPERLMTPWEADPAIACALGTGTWHDSVIVIATSCVRAGQVAPLACLQPAALATLRELHDPRDCELVGRDGIGRQTLAAQFACARYPALLGADLKALTEMQIAPLEALTRVLRLASITGSFAYFRNAELAAASDWQQARQLGVAYLRGVRHPSGHAVPIALAPLPIQERLKLWGSLSRATPPPSLRSVRLTPLEIVEVAASGRTRHKPRPDHGLLSILPTPYDWDDLVVSAELLAQLRALESQIRLRWPVYEEWGFARLAHLGLGITALFGGPSGTGKTMCAQILARTLNLELLRVDLAGVVNKYVGETEKRLREVFDACDDSSALLFFDEADALFGNRTQVRDAHDRFANIEIDYLLQRIERFDGVAILATNRRQDLDSAFVRRLRFVIEFLPPRPAERRALWQRALLPTAHDGQAIRGKIDWSYLSERLNMTGAEIKNTALNAAFLARAEDKPIGMQHVLAAAQSELAKQGTRLRPSWGNHVDA
jgi:ATPase family associated with various cellular activities (AAA)